MFLDGHCHPGELDDFFVRQGESVALGCGHVDGLDGLSGCRVVAEHHLDRLAAQVLAQDRMVTGLECGLVDVELVWIDCPLHDGLAEAVRGRDEDDVPKAALGVQREHDTGRTDVAADHHLDAGRQGHEAVIETLVYPVGDGPIIEQRGEDLVQGLYHVVEAAHVKESLLLAGERSVRQVLRRRGRAHGNGNVAAPR